MISEAAIAVGEATIAQTALLPCENHHHDIGDCTNNANHHRHHSLTLNRPPQSLNNHHRRDAHED